MKRRSYRSMHLGFLVGVSTLAGLAAPVQAMATECPRATQGQPSPGDLGGHTGLTPILDVPVIDGLKGTLRPDPEDEGICPATSTTGPDGTCIDIPDEEFPEPGTDAGDPAGPSEESVESNG